MTFLSTADLPCSVKVGFLYLAQSVAPTLLLLFVDNRPLLRLFWIGCSGWIAYEFFLLSQGTSVSPVRYSKAGTQIFIASIQALNVLIINPLTRDDLRHAGLFNESSPLLMQICHTTSSLFLALRGINTPWQVKNIPNHPRFLTARANPRISRTKFVVRQAAILAWQYLIMDLLYVLSLQDDSPHGLGLDNFKYLNVDAEEWTRRVAVALVTWFVAARVLIDSTYRAGSIVAVGLMGSAPEGWPPLFGSMWDAYTLRNFWGKLWHQFLRWPFTSLSNYIARDILKLARPSFIERYTNNLIVFLLSGFLHVMTDSMQGVPPYESGAMFFFPMFTLGFMIEDGVQNIWKRCEGAANGSKPSSAGPRLWQRILGLVWVMAWISVTSPRYLFPTQQQPRENRWMVPISIVQWTGVPASLVGVVVGGLIVAVVFQTEI